jgi:hypothetical protein
MGLEEALAPSPPPRISRLGAAEGTINPSKVVPTWYQRHRKLVLALAVGLGGLLGLSVLVVLIRFLLPPCRALDAQWDFESKYGLHEEDVQLPPVEPALWAGSPFYRGGGGQSTVLSLVGLNGGGGAAGKVYHGKAGPRWRDRLTYGPWLCRCWVRQGHVSVRPGPGLGPEGRECADSDAAELVWLSSRPTAFHICRRCIAHTAPVLATIAKPFSCIAAITTQFSRYRSIVAPLAHPVSR